MNIGIDIRCLMERNRSGIGRYTEYILCELFEMDKKNNYFLFYNNFKNFDLDLLDFDQANVKFVKRNVPNKLLNIFIWIFGWPSLDKFIKNDIDIFWAPGNNFISWSHEVKKIITCHDLTFKVLPRLYSWKGKLWHKFIKIDKLYLEADKIISVSEYTKSDLTRLYPNVENKIMVTHLGVIDNIDIDEQKLKDVKNKYSLPEKFVFYIGDIEPRKNIESIIKSWQEIKDDFSDLHLVLAGGEGWHNKYYKKIIQVVKQDDKISYFGYIPEDEKYYFYKLASLFLYPSFYEGFGLPPLEAMSMGCPVISSNSSSLPEVIGDAGLLVDPYNRGQIKYAIERILTDSELKNELIDNGFIRIKKFQWQSTAKQMLEIFNKL